MPVNENGAPTHPGTQAPHPSLSHLALPDALYLTYAYIRIRPCPGWSGVFFREHLSVPPIHDVPPKLRPAHVVALGAAVRPLFPSFLFTSRAGKHHTARNSHVQALVR